MKVLVYVIDGCSIKTASGVIRKVGSDNRYSFASDDGKKYLDGTWSENRYMLSETIRIRKDSRRRS